MSASHSDRFAGLQRHSLGDLYPWTVAVKGSDESQRCVPFHCTTGEWGPEFSVLAVGFKRAHQLAEQFARKRLEEDVNTLGYREPRGFESPPREQERPSDSKAASVAVVERVIASRHAFANSPNEGNLQRLFQAVDNLATEYGLRRLQATFGGLISSLVDATREERAAEIAKGLSARV